MTIAQPRSGVLERVVWVTSRSSIRRRLPRILTVLWVSCCFVAATYSQDFSLGPPLMNQPGILASDQLIEADSFRQINRVPVVTSSNPPFVIPADGSFTSPPIVTVQDRPEYPASELLPAPSTKTAEGEQTLLQGPMLLDWNLIEASSSDMRLDGTIEFATPIQIIAEAQPVSVGCVTCGSARLHSHGLTPGERFTSGILAALCPCDECYQPKWDLQQSTAFWIESARPQTRTRFGWDYGSSMMLADRAEYFWARVGGLGPPHPVAAGIAPLIVPEFNYHELSMYTEVGKGGFSFFTKLPYRSLYLDNFGHEAGFADMQVGTKSLLHDSPLMQIAFQMTTHIPSAVARKGLGTQHVSLEPALLLGFRLSRYNFLQAQVGQWIPIAGDPDYAGSLARWGVSWNHLAWSHDETTQMTTSLEVFGWSFQDGAYTDPVLGRQRANDETYVYLGPGCRLLFCNKWEFGVGGAFALTERHFAQSLIRSELTMRF